MKNFILRLLLLLFIVPFSCTKENKNVIKQPNDSKWITIDEIDKYPFPKANHKVFKLLNRQGWDV